MTRHESKPRKRRTRQHVIAAQSVNHVERFIVDAGHTAQRVEYDYGYDLLVSTFDEEGYEEPGLIYVQLKATDTIATSSTGAEVVFDLAVADCNLWIVETMPVLLVLFDAQTRQAWWLYVRDISQRSQRECPSVARIPSAFSSPSGSASAGERWRRCASGSVTSWNNHGGK